MQLVSQMGAQHQITKSIHYISKIVTQIADGDLNIDLEINYKNEIDKLVIELQKMIKRLGEVINNVSLLAGRIDSASSEVSSSSQNLAESANEQASAIEEISATIEEILTTVSNNSENTVQAEKFTDNSYQLAEKRNGITNDAVRTINDIKKSAERISDIVESINSISFQTNILALNAAVEAARAGEHGRSFAVVAAEVRRLAQRSGASSKDIETLIKNSVDQVSEGTRLVQESGGSFKEIFEAIVQVRQVALEITSASKEQQLGLKQITDSVTHTETATQQNAAIAEELSTMADSLSSNSSELTDAIKFFRL